MTSRPAFAVSEHAPSAARHDRLPRELTWYLGLIVGLCFLATAVLFVRSYIFQRAYPFNTFLFFPSERFSDFTHLLTRLPYLGTNRFWGDYGRAFIYPPLTDVAFVGYFFLPAPLFCYLATVVAAAAGLTCLLFASLRRRRIQVKYAILFSATALLTSYPLMFLIDRGNIEALVWVASSLALIAVARQRWWWAATFLAIAAAMKIFPVLLFPLLLSRKKWWECVYAIGLAAALTLVSLWILGPSIPEAYRGVLATISGLQRLNVLGDTPWETGFTHSAFSVVKQIMIFLGYCSPYYFAPAYLVYSISIAVLGLLMYFGRMRRLPILNQIIALTTCSVLFPGWAADYSLVHLYVPWGLLVLWIVDHARNQGARLLWYLLPFAIVFTPQPYFFFLAIRGYSGQVKAIALTVLLIASLWLRLPEESFDSPPAMQTSGSGRVGAEEFA